MNQYEVVFLVEVGESRGDFTETLRKVAEYSTAREALEDGIFGAGTEAVVALDRVGFVPRCNLCGERMRVSVRGHHHTDPSWEGKKVT